MEALMLRFPHLSESLNKSLKNWTMKIYSSPEKLQDHGKISLTEEIIHGCAFYLACKNGRTMIIPWLLENNDLEFVKHEKNYFLSNKN